MRAIESFRAAHQQLINENPVTVTMQRTERVSSSGGFAVTTSPVGPYTVRVYRESAAGLARLVTDLAGTQQRDTGWGLLAPWDADLRGDPDVYDELDMAGVGHFRLNDVAPLSYLGEAYGQRAALERIA